MKKTARSKLTPGTKKQPNFSPARSVAWMNIAMQVAFPLSLSFTPTPAIAEFSAPPEMTDRRLGEMKTVKYRLKAGESVYTVATRYGLSYSALMQLNRDRHFARGFRAAGEGDEITVPEKTPDDSEKTAQYLASTASQAAGFLASHPDSDAAAAMVKGMAVGKANQAVQEWMNQFGTAQVQIGVDENFSLKNSSASLLHPWYDNPKNLVFSQTGIHRTDDRTQANVGVGYRHFRDHDMLGVNTFLDYDLSRDHARAGLGAEYWRDNLKLSANAYIGLTRWRNSPDVEDYDERPASGWDVRAEGYLPSYPQLGGKLMYEQYYGNEVALFGKENRQKNPRAVTVGLNWTPVPLLTLGAEQRTGQDGKHETELKAQLNWRMGESLSHQLDPNAVAATRSLAGSRYDLIDRNNNIILEYRKQEVIRLRMPERIEGKSQQVVPLTLSVQAKHGLKDIEWDTAALVKAGGSLTGQGTQWQLTLPAWQVGAINAWQISAVAHDTKGNESKRAEMQVVLTAQQAGDKSTLVLNDDRLLADGKANTLVRLTLLDADGTPMTGMTDRLSLSGALTPDSSLVHGGTLLKSKAAIQADPMLSALKEEGNGVYSATLTAGVVAGHYLLTAKVDGVSLAQATVLLEDSQADFSLAETTLVADKSSILASGTDEATLTLTLKRKAADGSLEPVTGEADRLTLFIADSQVDSTQYTLSNVQEDTTHPGTYTATVSGQKMTTQLPIGLKANGHDTGKRVTLDVTSAATVAITGNPVVGDTLTASVAGASPSSTLTYQWQIEDTPGSGNYVDITGATALTYTPVQGDQKRKIRVAVTE